MNQTITPWDLFAAAALTGVLQNYSKALLHVPELIEKHAVKIAEQTANEMMIRREALLTTNEMGGQNGEK